MKFWYAVYEKIDDESERCAPVPRNRSGIKSVASQRNFFFLETLISNCSNYLNGLGI